jgi:uncharacterized protein YdhG (YjbR/CyaY superfamily)
MRYSKSGEIPRAKHTVFPATFDDYLAGVPESARSTLLRMRSAIRSALPAEARETISYRIPAFALKRVVVWFAAFSNHCSLFPTAAVIGDFREELKGYSTSKGTIHFPNDKPLPIELIKKLVKARVAKLESTERAAPIKKKSGAVSNRRS